MYKNSKDLNTKKRYYLNQVRRINHLINAKLEELENTRLKTKSIKAIDYSRADIDVVQSKRNKPSFSELIENCIEYEYQIEKSNVCLFELKKEISEVIDTVTDTEYRLFLQLYYINNKSYHAISDIMDKSYNTLRKLHSKAIDFIEIDISYIQGTKKNKVQQIYHQKNTKEQ